MFQTEPSRDLVDRRKKMGEITKRESQMPTVYRLKWGVALVDEKSH